MNERQNAHVKRKSCRHRRKGGLWKFPWNLGAVVIVLAVIVCFAASSYDHANTESLSAMKVDDTTPVANHNDVSSVLSEIGDTDNSSTSSETNMSANDTEHTTSGKNSATSESDTTGKHTSHNSSSEWNLILVNPWNSLPDNYSVTLTQLKNGQSVDERCYPDLQEMMDACRAAGLSPVICSSYRTQEYQEGLFNNQVENLVAQGYSRAEAEKEAGTVVAVPGTSEHQLGLAVDIVDVNYQLLDRGQEETEVQKWLMEHCWEYGFILRYPESKSEITGIIYEPWHYRYVGKKAAKEITESGICLAYNIY